jgi:hypothetical protein
MFKNSIFQCETLFGVCNLMLKSVQAAMYCPSFFINFDVAVIIDQERKKAIFLVHLLHYCIQPHSRPQKIATTSVRELIQSIF